jgi:hypothetical protein
MEAAECLEGAGMHSERQHEGCAGSQNMFCLGLTEDVEGGARHALDLDAHGDLRVRLLPRVLRRDEPHAGHTATTHTNLTGG